MEAIKQSRKIEVSEIFMSLEGEGPWTNRPTVYVRASRCNFKCPLFNNHNDTQLQDNGYATLTFNPKDFNTLQSLPLVDRGCDSQYSVNPDFAHMWARMSADEIAKELINKIPHNAWLHPITGTPVILSLTGGEPTLLNKFWPELLNHTLLTDLRHILIETNCAVPLKNEFLMEINKWLAGNPSRKITWSNSPKLSSSGELWVDAIKPEIAMKQRWNTGGTTPGQFEQYFKFVVEPTTESFGEVMKAMNEYWNVGIPRNVEIWAMPMACSEEQQQAIAQKVANMCMDYGFLYSHRVQNSLWGNGTGT
jgi:organic radical activating enzyme